MEVLTGTTLALVGAVVGWLSSRWHSRRGNSAMVLAAGEQDEDPDVGFELQVVEAPPSPDRYEILPQSAALASVLEPLLGRGGAAAHDVARSVGTVYRLSFAPGTMDGGASLMQAAGGGVRATAIESGRIVGQGVLHPANAMKAAGFAFAAWQLAAMVTAQKFLADINERLVGLENGVRRIQDWLETDRVGRLEASLHYAHETVHYLSTYAFDEAELRVRLHRLEYIDGECHAVMRACMRDLRALARNARQIEVPAGVNKGSAEIERLSSQWEAQADTFFYAAHTRAVAAQLRCALPASRDASIARLSGLLDEVEDSIGVLDSISQNLRQATTGLKAGWFTRGSTRDARRSELREDISARSNNTGGLAADLRSQLREVLEQNAHQQRVESEGMELLVVMREDGPQVWGRRIAP